MKLWSILGVSLLVSSIAAIPYVGLALFLMKTVANDGGPPAVPIAAFMALFGVAVPLGAVFLTIARLGWRTREQIVGTQLFGWPIGFCVLVTVAIGIPSASEGFACFLSVLGILLCCAAAGIGAALLWRKLLYAEPNVA